jgi:hypothetical protein
VGESKSENSRAGGIPRESARDSRGGLDGLIGGGDGTEGDGVAVDGAGGAGAVAVVDGPGVILDEGGAAAVLGGVEFVGCEERAEGVGGDDPAGRRGLGTWKGGFGRGDLQVSGPGVDGEVQGLWRGANLHGGEILKVVSLWDGFDDTRHGIAPGDWVEKGVVLFGEADGRAQGSTVLGVCLHQGLEAARCVLTDVLESGIENLGDGEPCLGCPLSQFGFSK